MMYYILFICLLVIALFLWRRKKNLAKTQIVKPKNKEELAENIGIIFAWEAPVRVRGSKLLYDLFLSDKDGGDMRLLKSNLSDNKFIYVEGLSRGCYRWEVMSKDGKGGFFESDESIFFIKETEREKVPEGVIVEGGVLKKWPSDKIPANGHVIIPNSVTSIGENAFYRCSSLISVAIPNSVASIGDYAFEDCSSLTSVEIPDSVTSIGEGAFYGCSSLTSIVIPDSVTNIGGAFSYCSSLTSIVIPNSVMSIEANAFSYCSSLTSVEIPNSVTSIGYCAFSSCSSLTSINCKAIQPPNIGNNSLGYKGKLIVPKGSKSKYETAEGWRECHPIVEE